LPRQQIFPPCEYTRYWRRRENLLAQQCATLPWAIIPQQYEKCGLTPDLRFGCIVEILSSNPGQTIMSIAGVSASTSTGFAQQIAQQAHATAAAQTAATVQAAAATRAGTIGQAAATTQQASTTQQAGPVHHQHRHGGGGGSDQPPATGATATASSGSTGVNMFA
jgi:hypothetical protein